MKSEVPVFWLLACKMPTPTPSEADADADADADSDADADADSDADADTDTDSDTDAGVQIRGVVHFEAPPPACGLDCFLDYANSFEKPVRHHRVALRGPNGGTLMETHTDETGAFSFAFGGTQTEGSVFLFADATLPSGRASVQIRDNTDGDVLWGSDLGPVDLTVPTALDLLLEDGWAGSSYTHRASGPFAISEAVLEISEAYLDSDPAYDLEPLTVFWSPDNQPTDGDESQGLIGTSFYRDDETAIYLLGAADIDTDEFDKHIVFHEWMHFFQDTESRSDSNGGSHPFGSFLDPRVAWGEGSATAVSALTYHTLPYTDVRGHAQVGGFDDELEDTNSFRGFWSEESVEQVVYDLYDSDDEAGIDVVSLPRDDLWERLIEQRDEVAFVTLFSFTTRVKEAHPTLAVDDIVVDAGLDPVADIFGSTETHDADWAANLPVYHFLDDRASHALAFDGTVRSNRLGKARLATFTGTGETLTVSATSNEDVDIFVYRAGTFIGSARNYCNHPPCTEVEEVDTLDGAVYRVEIEGYGDPENYPATVEIH